MFVFNQKSMKFGKSCFNLFPQLNLEKISNLHLDIIGEKKVIWMQSHAVSLLFSMLVNIPRCPVALNLQQIII